MQGFDGSENAVKTQIWIAVSVYVLVAIVKKRLNIKVIFYDIVVVSRPHLKTTSPHFAKDRSEWIFAIASFHTAYPNN